MSPQDATQAAAGAAAASVIADPLDAVVLGYVMSCISLCPRAHSLAAFTCVTVLIATHFTTRAAFIRLHRYRKLALVTTATRTTALACLTHIAAP